VGDANGGISRVDMLHGRTGRAIDVDLEVAVGNLRVHFLRFGKNRDGRGGGMDAPAAFGDGHALDAVDAAFELQLGEDPGAGDAGDDVLEAADFRRIGGYHFHLPTLRVYIALIHAVQVA